MRGFKLLAGLLLIFAGLLSLSHGDVAEAASKKKRVKPVAVKIKVPKPDYPPLPNEFYPTGNKAFPSAMTNPNAHTRNVGFFGKPLDIYTKINMVTQIELPSPPVLVNIGRPEGFTVEVIPEFNNIFVKPVKQVEMTNLIVTTAGGGVYLFLLKENPYVPWDMRVSVMDPYKNTAVTDSRILIHSAVTGKRPVEYPMMPMDIRTPNSSAYVFDPLTKIGCRMVLKRAVVFPRHNQAVYWIELTNSASNGDGLSGETFSIDEKSVWTSGIRKVAIPGFRNDKGIPILSKGQRTHLFLLVQADKIPRILKFRFAIYGSRNLPIEAALPTGNAVLLRGEKTRDEKLAQTYDEMVKKGQIKPVNPNVPKTEPQTEAGGTVPTTATGEQSQYVPGPGILIDTSVPGKPGGNGQDVTFPPGAGQN